MVLTKKTKSSTCAKFLVMTRINLLFLFAFFLIIYANFNLLYPWATDYYKQAESLVKCSLNNAIDIDCPHYFRKENQKPSFLSELIQGADQVMKIGLVNMNNEDVIDWRKTYGHFIIPTAISFEKVSELVKWKDLFPTWIDEEGEFDGPSCPEIPMLSDNNNEIHGHDMDMIVAKLPCKFGEEGWNRDVFRLQVHLVAANLAVKRGKRDSTGRLKVVFVSKWMPMVELFRCDELVTREGEWWYYRPEIERLEHKVSFPVGSCNLAMPLWDKGIKEAYGASKLNRGIKQTTNREAYATMLHSKESYVCGALTLAQSLIQTRTHRDLILLHDTSISEPKREALSRAGWKLRFIGRISNPKARNNTYNQHNYSKFRVWQLTDYDKIVFIDVDILVLRNLDILFQLPQMSAAGNSRSIFNSGIMVIEPSNCTFRMFMNRIEEIVSYNGGDQGFLNEIFPWWHRLPRRVNFLKYFRSNEVSVRNDQLFRSDPPKLYSIHYLGSKPWLCYRDYDCNFDIPGQRVFASDVAHTRWWKFYDQMDEGLQKVCGLSERRKIELEWNRNKAKENGYEDQHWRINVTDPRKLP
ncbi:hypothetical protein RD792_002753 [Penstemon davidsonii]|uniref:Hexosyltransferase n=1 Tax=Penstemon davidsonii TaxID=160366 RepID=A0ABR0DSC2_9LAMI|nr:hypothetical protein RD792_002753 [Penstemon davidsonii]